MRLMSEAQKTPFDAYIADRVKNLRQSNSMSQADLGFLLGVTATFIGHTENPNKRAKYNVAHIHKLKRIFHCNYEDIFPPEGQLEFTSKYQSE